MKSCQPKLEDWDQTYKVVKWLENSRRSHHPLQIALAREVDAPHLTTDRSAQPGKHDAENVAKWDTFMTSGLLYSECGRGLFRWQGQLRSVSRNRIGWRQWIVENQATPGWTVGRMEKWHGSWRDSHTWRAVSAAKGKNIVIYTQAHSWSWSAAIDREWGTWNFLSKERPIYCRTGRLPRSRIQPSRAEDWGQIFRPLVSSGGWE
jgi:hypothetical protein